MKAFSHLEQIEKEEIFFKLPEAIHMTDDRELLAYALGATLYMPAVKKNFSELFLRQKYKELMSVVIDLEDAIGDKQVLDAEHNLITEFQKLYKSISSSEIDIPLIFVRVRKAEQMLSLSQRFGESLPLLAGFVFPKFSSFNGEDYLYTLLRINEDYSSLLGRPIYGMPILESASIIYRETRNQELLILKGIVDRFSEYVLNIRVGATDFSSLFGLRRSPEYTIYDLAVVRDCVADIANYFLRQDASYAISGPVWEYFSQHGDRLFKPQLRTSIFENEWGKEGLKLREHLIRNHSDGLIRETALDRENGLIGKTIIHPSHIQIVQSLYVVSKEEYQDALLIINNNDGECGVIKSEYQNKMNEIKPHLNWAKKISKRALVYGVLNENHSFSSLLRERAPLSL